MTEVAIDHGVFCFSLAESGLTRWPPNIEQIRVERDSLRTWLIARRNDVELRFPLEPEDCEHLAKLLREAVGAKPGD